MNPWICPKCGRVWGPMVIGCGPCNSTTITLPGAMQPVPGLDNATGTPLPPLPRITCESVTEGQPITVAEGCAAAVSRHLEQRQP